MLERIQKENDIKKLNSEELECLAGEIDVYKRQLYCSSIMEDIVSTFWTHRDIRTSQRIHTVL